MARGGGRRREIALTFDDGPGPYTPKVLIALNRLNVRRRSSSSAARRRRSTRRCSPPSAAATSSASTPRATAASPRCPTSTSTPSSGPDRVAVALRPAAPAALPPALRRLRRRDARRSSSGSGCSWCCGRWTPSDYERPGVERIADGVVGAARPGAIILMHDGGGDRTQTIAAIPKIVRAPAREALPLRHRARAAARRPAAGRPAAAAAAAQQRGLSPTRPAPRPAG